ncbi:carbon-nitrogen hydrolase family protein, partial [Pseudomonas sp.]|uniref:carbon-nitrogen hydrolase family protein n=1 Tax=Pseudomonas sp. TaxID=306 RepID=UPI0028A043DF
MKLCAVQLASDKGDLQANLLRHVHCVEQAVRHGAQVVVFPELSLSGYVPSLARELAQPLDTTPVDPLQAVSDRHGVVIAFGLPLATAAGVQIAMAVLRSAQPRLGYAKQRVQAAEL